MTALQKYLANQPTRYAEAEAHGLNDVPGQYRHALVIPMYRESPATLQRFVHFAEQQPATLLIVIANRPDSDADTDWAEALLHSPQVTRHAPCWQSVDRRLVLHSLAANSALLLVDRCLQGPPLPVKQGVGLARKIGADIACALIHRHIVSSPWIATTDADAQLPDNYFAALAGLDAEQPKSSPAIAAVIYPYRHIFIDQIPQLPTLLYEFSLHYYVAGLHFASSPYAYHTLGSTLALHYSHYAKVRGFPKRAGAEDFYMLNKLAKTGAVHSLLQPEIQLQARESTRVPFGTGPAVTNLAAQHNPLAMPLYHPHCFSYLRVFLALLTEVARQPGDIPRTARRLLTALSPTLAVEPLLALLETIQLAAAVAHSRRHGKTAARRLQHLHHWFDGFKTLRFIHQLRDQHCGTLSFQQWHDNPALRPFAATPAMQRTLQQIKMRA